jgi:hypothetical protein
MHGMPNTLVHWGGHGLQLTLPYLVGTLQQLVHGMWPQQASDQS